MTDAELLTFGLQVKAAFQAGLIDEEEALAVLAELPFEVSLALAELESVCQ